MVSATGMTPKESWKSREFELAEPPRQPVDYNMREPQDAVRETARPSRELTDAKHELSAQPMAVESMPRDNDQARGGVQQREKLFHASGSIQPGRLGATGHIMSQPKAPRSEASSFTEPRKDSDQSVRPEYAQDVPSTATSRTPRLAHSHEVLESTHDSRYGEEEDLSPISSRHKKYKYLDATQPTTISSRGTSSSQTTELNKRYEALSKEHESVRGELQAKNFLLEKKDHQIRSLNAQVSDLQRNCAEQSSALASARHESRLSQSQLDNVQRFISTADTHSDQDIIQKLQELNEEVYQTSMTMADHVAEVFARQSTTTSQKKLHISVGESVLRTIGQVILHYLAAMKEGEDIALFLQIAFQGYFSHMLCHIISSWTVDERLNALIEGTYRRLQKAETQAVSGRWRSFTRAHILPTFTNDPKPLFEHTIAGLSDVVVTAGLVSTHRDAMTRLSSEFGEKITSIVSHAGMFSNMVSEMVSGDFEVFAVPPDAAFERESMTDMNRDQAAPRGTGAVQTVLCVSRVGLRKQIGEKTITLTKAQVVLKSFLG